MNDLNIYNNKYFSILGDSISTLEDYSIPSDTCFYSFINRCQTQIYEVLDTWWGIVINKYWMENRKYNIEEYCSIINNYSKELEC